MKQLTSFSLYSQALKLQQALQAAGIEATISSEETNSYIGTRQNVVWVADHASPDELRRICQSIAGPDSANPDLLPTTVSIAEGTTQCRSCGLDLRSQEKGGNCPVCGRPFVIVLERTCPGCGADVPDTFDVCWKCNAELPPPLPAHRPPLLPPPLPI
jgi:hypothetical protein